MVLCHQCQIRGDKNSGRNPNYHDNSGKALLIIHFPFKMVYQETSVKLVFWNKKNTTLNARVQPIITMQGGFECVQYHTTINNLLSLGLSGSSSPLLPPSLFAVL